MNPSDYKHLRQKAERLGVRIGIAFRYEDKQRLLASTSDEEFLHIHSDIEDSISGVFRANLRLNHSNYRGLRCLGAGSHRSV